MREIKFRDAIFRKTWNEEKKVIEDDFKGFHYWGFLDGDGSFMTPQNLDIDKSQQFTGLKDKNGKDIYEGDILSYGNKKDEIIIKIVWVDLSDNGFKIIKQKNKHILHDIRIYRFDEVAEVIGNIYENPELLEKNEVEKK